MVDAFGLFNFSVLFDEKLRLALDLFASNNESGVKLCIGAFCYCGTKTALPLRLLYQPENLFRQLNIVLLDHLSHVDQCVPHSPKRSIDTHIAALCDFFEAHASVVAH